MRCTAEAAVLRDGLHAQGRCIQKLPGRIDAGLQNVLVRCDPHNFPKAPHIVADTHSFPACQMRNRQILLSIVGPDVGGRFPDGSLDLRLEAFLGGAHHQRKEIVDTHGKLMGVHPVALIQQSE